MMRPADSTQPEAANSTTAAALPPLSQDLLLARVITASVSLIRLGMPLVLLAMIAYFYEIESTAFWHICLLAFSGAMVLRVLPSEQHLPFFTVLSFAAIFLIFGVMEGIWLVGFGLVFVGLCHLPVAYGLRVVLLLLAGAAVAALRVEFIEGPWSRAIWPILGSMFMFRLMVYVYDLRHPTVPFSPMRTLAYFFMLPNVCFPMFPVVDYKTFVRSNRTMSLDEVQFVGVEWILRGFIQLILYRFVYHYLAMSPADVTNPADFGRFVVANYLLYLRISGQFHVIVGMLRLFGFNLPETHRRYLLAASVNDFWRRINIYWKDFMMKLFFFPSIFALKKRGVSERTALILATIIVFVSTWLLHSYQWFWLRGSFPLTYTDGLFWGALGALVVMNTLWELRRGRRPVAARTPLAELTGVGLRTAMTFCLICILWSLWTAESVTQWGALWIAAFSNGVSQQTLHALSVGVVAVVLGSAADGGGSSPLAQRQSGTRLHLRRRRYALTTAAILGVLLIGHSRVYGLLGDSGAEVMRTLRKQKLNTLDTAALERGYYENLVSVERFNGQLWELYMKRPANWGNLREVGGMRRVDHFLLEELVPSLEIPFKGSTLRTNRWGMRNPEIEQGRPDGTRRIAVFGPSDTMGAGVEMEETFAALLQQKLNASVSSSRYEVLNFGTSNYTPPQHLALLRDRALPFDPEITIVVGHDDDALRAVRHLASVVSQGIPIPFPELSAMVAAAGVVAGMPEAEAAARLQPHADRILRWVYAEIVEMSRARGIQPVWVFLPFLVENAPSVDVTLIEHARSAGFNVLDFSDIYDARDIASFRIADWDLHHPNREGHALIADRLSRELASQGVLAARRDAAEASH